MVLRVKSIIFHLDILGTYIRITPRNLNLGLTGFGYSFSNVGDRIFRNGIPYLNGKPYFAVGAVNINGGESKAILFNSALLCIKLRKECRSTTAIRPNVISEDDRGKFLIIMKSLKME